MADEVSAALSKPLLGHLHLEFVKIMDDTREGIKYLFQTENRWTLAVSGTGHAAMEAACVNLLEPGELALICVNGIWGERFADMVERVGARHELLRQAAGAVMQVAQVAAALQEHRPALLFVTHVESSSGALQPLRALGELCRDMGTLLLVDSVAGAGGVPLFMDEWAIDCLYTGSQKCLGCTPGICPISFSERARNKILTRKSRIPSFYLDMTHLTNYWQCENTSEARRYHHTGPVSLIYALRESLRLLAQEGLVASWRRHADAAQRLYAGLQELGLELFVSGEEERAPTVSTIKVPEAIDWQAVSKYCMTQHSVEVAGGLGPTAGKVWRIGLMGVNASSECVDRVLLVLKEALQQQQYKKASL